VEVTGSPAGSPEDAAYFVRWIDRLVASAGARSEWNTPDEREAVMKSLGDARAVFEGLAASGGAH
jgi:hypothetical protein